MHLPGRLVAIAAFAMAISSGDVSGQPLKVGSKDFTEQLIVAELYAASLEASGIAVERKINLGPTLVVHQALVSGAIDLYPEYMGTALAAVMKVATDTYSPKEAYQRVKSYYEKEYKLLWLAPTRLNNGYALVVRPETAQSLNLNTLSDLAKVAGKLKLGAGLEFGDRRDGVRGLKEVYSMQFSEYRQFAALPARYEALMRKQIDVANGFATDWQIAAQRLVVLSDNRDLFPPYILAPVVRMDTVAHNPKAIQALERVGALLDNPVMQDLNREVELDKKEPRQVAAAFLRSKGILPLK